MERNKKIAVLLAVLVIYGSSITLLKGNLPNQTANIATVHGSKIQSLVPWETVAANLSLACEAWNITGENVTHFNFDEKLIISGNYTDDTLYQNKMLPLFVAKQTGLRLNFTENPYFHVVISSQPDTETALFLGLRDLNQNVSIGFLERSPGVIVETDGSERIIWVNISDPYGGEKINNETSYVTIDVAGRLRELGLVGQQFVGVQIRQYLIGFVPFEKSYKITIKSISLMKKPLYHLEMTEGRSRYLTDGSTVHIIKKESMANNFEEYPYLQRAYVLYTMEAPQDTLYTIFLLSKHDKNITVVKSDFLFTHTNSLNEIGTYVDWRRPLWLDLDFEPVATLYSIMGNGDYAFIFTPLKGSVLQGTQLQRVELTFSKLQYSSFVITSFSEQVLLVMSIFIVIAAGILPTALMFVLLYMHKKEKLKTDKNTTIKILVTGLAIRLILAPISAYTDDVQIFAQLGSLYFGSGVLGAQWVSLPGFVYLETAAYFPYALLRALGFQDSQFLGLAIYGVEALFAKIPSILSDLGSFYYIQRMAAKCSPRNEMLFSGLYLLNPLVVYISGVLGQFDSIFTFLLIAFVYYLVVNYNKVKATIFSSFAAILNPVGIATLIPLLAKVNLKENSRAVAKTLLLVTGIFSLLMLPFFFEPKSPMFLASYHRLLGGVPGESFYGMQIGFYAYGTLISSSVGYGLTFRLLLKVMGVQLGPLLYPYGTAVFFLSFVGGFIYKTRKAHVIDINYMVYTVTFMLGVVSLFQLTFPTIFSQFAIWIVGLLLISSILCQNRTFLLIFLLLSITAGFTLVLAWRNYLLLISGVGKAPLGNPYIADIASALLGTMYSIVLFVILMMILKIWIKNTKYAPS